MSHPDAARVRAAGLYRTIWRWHFYAGLFVIPFILILSVTGAIYLFKPQIDRWEERAFQGFPASRTVAPTAQVEAALAAHPGARFDSYRLPERPGDAAMVHIALAGNTAMRDVFVSPQGRVLATRDPEATISATVANIHGSLLIGTLGDWLVELAATWAIVMIITGLYLWWPRGRGLAGTVWPRARAGLRDVHAVTGFWVAGLALVLLVSGLPWSGVWGNGFAAVRTAMGWTKDRPDWKLAAAPRAEHAGHDHAAMAMREDAPSLDRLSEMVAHARAERLPFPALVKPPLAPSTDWVVKSEAQNRTINRTIRFSAMTGAETGRTGWADKHPIDQAINLGIAWHEGALFGWVNQLVGLFTAVALVTLAVTSLLMWWRRRPTGMLGAPPVPAMPARIGGVAAIVVGLALVLPLLALSLAAILVLEWLVLKRFAPVARWLGLRPRAVRAS